MAKGDLNSGGKNLDNGAKKVRKPRVKKTPDTDSPKGAETIITPEEAISTENIAANEKIEIAENLSDKKPETTPEPTKEEAAKPEPTKEVKENTEREKPIMWPNTKKIIKGTAKETANILVKTVKLTIKWVTYIVKLIFKLFGGKWVLVLAGLIVVGAFIGLKKCGTGTGRVEIQKLKIGDIIIPEDRTNDIIVWDNTYTYTKEITIDNQAGKFTLFGKTFGIPLWGLDDDKVTANVDANVESGYNFDKIKDLPIEVSSKIDKNGDVIRQEVEVQDMTLIDTLKVIFKEWTAITEDKSVLTKLWLDDNELKKIITDSLNDEKMGEILKIHLENLNRNGAEFRELAIRKMRQLLIAGRKLTSKEEIKDIYLKITFPDRIGKKYIYVTNGVTIIPLWESNIPVNNDNAKNGQIVVDMNPDAYGPLFGKAYPTEK